MALDRKASHFSIYQEIKKVRPKKLKIRNLVFISSKAQGIYYDFTILSGSSFMTFRSAGKKALHGHITFKGTQA
jgi:hypothetical protein